MQRIAIAGGGISGLVTAYRLSEQCRREGIEARITVLEEKDRFGGLVRSRFWDGFLIEEGPDSFSTDRPWAVQLCRELGLENELLGTNPEHRRVSIASDKKLFKLPEGFYFFAKPSFKSLIQMPLVSGFGKLRMAMEPWIRPRLEPIDESVASFLARRFGREMMQKIGRPLVGSIFACPIDELSLQASLPQFLEMERRYGSIVRGLQAHARKKQSATVSGPTYPPFLTLRGGLERLIHRLVERLDQNVELRNLAGVQKIEKNGVWKLQLQSEETLEVDALCLALPAARTAQLVRAFDLPLGEQLGSIDSRSLVVVNLGFRQSDLASLPQGSGFLWDVRSEGPRLTGVTFSSNKFNERAPTGRVLMRVFLTEDPSEFKQDEAVTQFVMSELKKVIPTIAAPIFSFVSRHIQRMPHYRVGHGQKIQSISEKMSQYPGLFITGQSYHGIGIPRCIRSAETTAGEIISYLKYDRALSTGEPVLAQGDWQI